MFKQVFEDPVDSAQDIIDRGLIPVVMPGASAWQWHLYLSDNDLYKKLAMVSVEAKDFDEYNYLIQYHVQGNGTHVLMYPAIHKGSRKFGRYHLSKEIIEGFNPYNGWITNKLFYLGDELAYHMLIFQQVSLIL